MIAQSKWILVLRKYLTKEESIVYVVDKEDGIVATIGDINAIDATGKNVEKSIVAGLCFIILLIIEVCILNVGVSFL